jgi:hypothetical protein
MKKTAKDEDDRACNEDECDCDDNEGTGLFVHYFIVVAIGFIIIFVPSSKYPKVSHCVVHNVSKVGVIRNPHPLVSETLSSSLSIFLPCSSPRPKCKLRNLKRIRLSFSSFFLFLKIF